MNKYSNKNKDRICSMEYKVIDKQVFGRMALE